VTGPDPADPRTAPIPRPVRRGSLARRVTVSCLVVAMVAVAVTALVALRLVSITARQAAGAVLDQQADVLAAQLDDAGAGPLRAAIGTRRVVQVLRRQDITVATLGNGQPLPAGAVGDALRQAGADRAAGGSPVSADVEVAGSVYLVAARPTQFGAFALVREADAGLIPPGVVRRNIGFAVLVGIATALLVGAAAGALMARPLRHTAAAAQLLRGGRRDVRVPATGPQEIAAVATAVNELADALARSERRQRDFLLSVSHELRTPLTAVQGFAESLADGVLTGPDVAPAGRVIGTEAARLDRLVGDLMELARLEADDFRVDLLDVDLAALVGEAVPAWQERCRSGDVAFRVELPGRPIPVRTDPRRLRQVLDGLAENALRVLPPGAPLVFAAGADAGRGVLQVRDGGPGLTAQDYAMVFERGALHDRYRGVRPVGTGGIGLALVHGLVRRMGGTVRAQPGPEGGACFVVTLPPARPSS
jgi:two-component system OmpR family sensor kinase